MTWRRAEDLVVAGQPIGAVDIAIMEGGPEVSLLGLNALSRLASVTMMDDQMIIDFK